MNKRLGTVVSGSLSKGLEVRLDGEASIEDVSVGSYVTIKGEKKYFFGMISDVNLESSDPELTHAIPEAGDPFISSILNGTAAYSTLKVNPHLVISGEAAALLEGPQPVKTIPTHFSPVYLASERDIEIVFGKEDKSKFFIGTPLDMETKICLDLQEFVKRSNGVFGKSGTGKTFFTRLLLIGMLQKSRAANLIFDLHSEYGWSGTSETGGAVKSLKQLFPQEVAVFTLDEESSKRRGVKTDFTVRIGLDEIEPQDIAILKGILNMTDLAVEATYQLQQRYGQSWFSKALELNEDEAKNLNIAASTLQSLKRGLNSLKRHPFLAPQAPESAVQRILSFLEQGRSVVLEFGRYRSVDIYVLIANLLSRRIYDRYREMSEEAEAGLRQKPTPLVITIEEAHQFLNPEVSSQTIFGTIAREMRKFNVTLLVIDQRPSGIDEDVMSQLGTKIVFQLDNERDIENVLAGTAGKSELRTVLEKLGPRRQAIIFGHAVMMPIVIKVREFGSKESYRELLPPYDTEKEIEDLWS